jgi:hypothetical protein
MAWAKEVVLVASGGTDGRLVAAILSQHARVNGRIDNASIPVITNGAMQSKKPKSLAATDFFRLDAD